MGRFTDRWMCDFIEGCWERWECNKMAADGTEGKVGVTEQLVCVWWEV